MQFQNDLDKFLIFLNNMNFQKKNQQIFLIYEQFKLINWLSQILDYKANMQN